MTHYRALSFSFFAASAGALLLFTAPASAQQSECQPNDLFCAELRIGPAQGGIRIGPGGQPQPPPPVIVQEPAPPVVVVQPEYQPPPPPPQPVYVQQPPPPVTQYVVEAPPRRVVVRDRNRFPYSTWGLRLHVDGVFGDELAMGGAGGALRIRPNPWFALDIGSGVYGGNDYNGLDRIEVPITLDAVVFFNPQHRFQVYMLAGVGTSFGHAEGFNVRTGNADFRDYVHLGGQVGLGVEWRLGRFFALNLDVRGFMRYRVDGNPEPEFSERDALGNVLSTDLSGGVVARGGMTFYFGR